MIKYEDNIIRKMILLNFLNKIFSNINDKLIMVFYMHIYLNTFFILEIVTHYFCIRNFNEHLFEFYLHWCEASSSN